MAATLPDRIVLDVKKKTLTVDGQPFPYAIGLSGPEVLNIGSDDEPGEILVPIRAMSIDVVLGG